MSAGDDKEKGLLLRSDVSFKYLQVFLFPGESPQNEVTLYHQKHMAMTLLASFLYSAHLPERLAPGCFDYIGECAVALLPLPSIPEGSIPDTCDAAAAGRPGQGEGEARAGREAPFRKFSRCWPR